MKRNVSFIPKLLLYLRVSKDEQHKENFSIETQRARCLRKCDEVYGRGAYEVEEIVEDESGYYGYEKSGVSDRIRPGLKLAKETLSDGSFDAMVVYRVDRFGRSLRWQLQFLEDVLLPTDTQLISISEGINTKDAGGVQALQMFGMMAQWQRQAIVDRNKDAAAKRAEEGYLVGQVGYGWQWEPLAMTEGKTRRGILPIKEHGHWIRKMADWYVNGWHSGRIAYELNKFGVTPPCGEGKWNVIGVLRILANPLHAGLVRLGDGYVRGQHFEHRYYDPDVFYRMIDERKSRKRWGNITSHCQKHLLAGIIVCAECGRRLKVAVSTGPYRSYRCPSEPSPEGDKCRRVYLNADLIETVVVSEMRALTESEPIQALMAEEAGRMLGSQDESLAAERDQLRYTLSKIKEQFGRWADAFTNGTITETEFREYKTDLLQRRAEAEERMSEVEAALASRDRRENQLNRVLQTLQDFSKVWQHLRFDERRHVLDLLIERVTAERHGRDMTVRLKLQLLPEREITIPILTAKDRKTKPQGVDGLSPRQLALLKHIADGRSKREIAELWDVDAKCVESHISQVRKFLGMYDLGEAAHLAMPRINSMLAFLPLEGRSPKATSKPSTELPETLRVVLPYVVNGATTTEIARMTGLKRSTVLGRRTRLMEFFKVHGAYELGQRARAMGLL